DLVRPSRKLQIHSAIRRSADCAEFWIPASDRVPPLSDCGPGAQPTGAFGRRPLCSDAGAEQPLLRCNLVACDSSTASGQERPVARNRSPPLLSHPGRHGRVSFINSHRPVAPDSGRNSLVGIPGGNLRTLAWSEARSTSAEPLTRDFGGRTEDPCRTLLRCTDRSLSESSKARVGRRLRSAVRLSIT